MDKARFQNEMQEFKREALQVIKNSAPVRTGNLQSSVKVRDLSNGGFEIYIDTGQAPYAEATTDSWISPKWNGRENPNEGWDDEASALVIRRGAQRFKTKITKGVTEDNE